VSEKQTRIQSVRNHSGQTIVLFVYAVVVAIAGFWGFLLGSLGLTELRPVSLFFIIELQPTPLGLAIYGMGTIGVGLGIILLLVRYASRRYAT
jgi:hypothetical protein